MKKTRYIIGIDLGTTNSTLSYIDTQHDSGNAIQTFAIPQLTDEGVVKEMTALPSFLYLPGKHELPEEATALPWDRNPPRIAGELARLQGSRVPAHLVASAKSWLCHSRVDRKAGILPWGSEQTEQKVSPVEASAQYLRHMKDAWNHTLAGSDSSAFLEKQQVIVTIPASFDESARELTAEAAQQAGIEDFTMVEEPQAAFYAWIASHHHNWQELTGDGNLVLVFDVGGGTTDFTLISIHHEKDRPSFQRVAVGDHIMLGGDNMDLTLARTIEQKMSAGGKFDFNQWLSATYQCRMAKEELLGDSDKEGIPITVLGKGRSVVGGSRKAELTAEVIQETIINGFFREVAVSEPLEKKKVAGLQELGLPFESDTAIMKHLSSFLRRHVSNKDLSHVTDARSREAVVRPDIVLFNGGVFKSPAICDHAASIIRTWFSDGQWSLNILENDAFDQAVSIGAAYYGLVSRGKGERISGGTGRAYYIAVETADARSAEDLSHLLSLVCIVPRGVEEGKEIHLSQPEFQVMTNSPVSFSIYSSSYRAGDRAGDVITAEKEEFLELPPVRTVMHFGKKSASRKIPVSLGIRINEYGTMDVWCESLQSNHRWKLAFQLRGELTEQDVSIKEKGMEHTLDESAVARAADIMDTAFHTSPHIPSDITTENLIKKMEEVLGLGRKSWPLPAIRSLWDAQMELKDRRGTTALHESRWLNLCGFLLRPGFGYELDQVRIRELWKIYLAGLQFPNSGQCRTDWWILWRRVAGGIEASKQEVIYRKVAPWLIPSKKKTKKVSQAETAEMWMLAASLESLAPSIKTDLGTVLLQKIKKAKGRTAELYFWALSRVGARSPFHGSIDKVVPRETAEQWIEALLTGKWANQKSAVYTLSQLARKTGDRLRDISDDLRARVIDALSQHDRTDHAIRQIEEVTQLDQEDEKHIYGESLPAGLYIDAGK